MLPNATAVNARACARLRACALVALTLVATTSCRRTKTPTRIHAVDGADSLLPRVERGNRASHAGAPEPHAIDVAGKRRTYLVIAPAKLDAAKRYPLVLVFHGDGGDARGFHEAWPFERATGGDAFVAYLDGLLARWDLETTKDNPDVAFVERVVDAVAKAAPIDRARVFGTGYSSGGFLANVTACQRPGLFRAIASNAGGAPYNQLEKWPNGSPKCPGQQPTATLALHGERDFTVTLDSGRYTAEYWASVNGCAEHDLETTAYAECQAYRGCPAGKAVAFCSVPPLGHWVWDEAADASWTFFQRQ